MLDWGGLAEEVVAHEVNVFPKPRTVGFVEAIQLAISYPDIGRRADLPEGLDVRSGTHAAGARRGRRRRHGGGRDRQDPRRDGNRHRRRRSARRSSPRAHGADHVIDYSATDFREEVLRITGGRGVDVSTTRRRRCLHPVAALHGGGRTHLSHRLCQRHHSADSGQHPAGQDAGRDGLQLRLLCRLESARRALRGSASHACPGGAKSATGASRDFAARMSTVPSPFPRHLRRCVPFWSAA